MCVLYVCMCVCCCFYCCSLMLCCCCCCLFVLLKGFSFEFVSSFDRIHSFCIYISSGKNEISFVFLSFKISKDQSSSRFSLVHILFAVRRWRILLLFCRKSKSPDWSTRCFSWGGIKIILTFACICSSTDEWTIITSST